MNNRADEVFEQDFFEQCAYRYDQNFGMINAFCGELKRVRLEFCHLQNLPPEIESRQVSNKYTIRTLKLLYLSPWNVNRGKVRLGISVS